MKARFKQVVALVGVITLIGSQNGMSVTLASETSNAEPETTVVTELEGEDTVAEESSEDISEKADEKSDESTEEATKEDAKLDNESESTLNEEVSQEEITQEEETDEDTTEEETTEEEIEDYGIMLLADDSAEVKLATNFRWNDDKPGEAIFYNPNEGNVSYVLHPIDENGHRLTTYEGGLNGKSDVYIPVYYDIMDSGKYTFKVEMFGYGVERDYDLSSGYVSEDSTVIFEYVKPSTQLSTPSNISVSSDGRVTWTTVEHAERYVCYIYYADATNSYYNGYTPISGVTCMDTSYDISNLLAEGREYYIRVRAISENINSYANSEYSEYMSVDTSIAANKVNNTLENAIDGTKNASENVESVKSNFADDTSKRELQVAMQTNSTTQETIKNLEDDYTKEKGLNTTITASEDTGIDDKQVSILGAALNATEQGGTISFGLSKPDEETQKDLVTNTRFTKAVVLDISLEGAGIEKGKELDIPVTVTMPAPTGIDISKLTVLHYNTDGSYETLTVRKNSDGTISFTVTHFSYFVFAEEETPLNPTPSSSDSGSGSSSDSSDSSDVAVATPTPQPTIGTSTGWNALSSEVDKAIANATATSAVVNINLNGVDTIPATAITAIAGKNVTLALSVDAKTLVTIDGSQLTAADASEVKLVSGKSADGNAILSVRAQNVDLQKSIVVYTNIGTDKVGSEVVLNFVDADQSLIEFRTSPVFENGFAAFITPLVNANYIITVK